MLANCPKLLRAQRLATLRLARAFRASDVAESALNAARDELDEAFREWSAGKSTNRREARAMLELAGLIERKPL
jgi:hypothetical protein